MLKFISLNSGYNKSIKGFTLFLKTLFIILYIAADGDNNHNKKPKKLILLKLIPPAYKNHIIQGMFKTVIKPIFLIGKYPLYISTQIKNQYKKIDKALLILFLNPFLYIT